MSDFTFADWRCFAPEVTWARYESARARAEEARATIRRMGDAIYDALGDDWRGGNVESIKQLRARAESAEDQARQFRYVAFFLVQDLGGEVRIPHARFVKCPKGATLTHLEDQTSRDLVLCAHLDAKGGERE